MDSQDAGRRGRRHERVGPALRHGPQPASKKSNGAAGKQEIKWLSRQARNQMVQLVSKKLKWPASKQDGRTTKET